MKHRKFNSVLLLSGLLLSLISWIPTPASGADATVSTSTGGTATYSAATGHYYEYVSGTVDFSIAKSTAESARANGWAGYLATVTSSGEAAAVTAVAGSAIGYWIGGSDAAAEGCWRWVNGSSADLSAPFFSGVGVTNCPVGGSSFTNWGSGEPNGSTGENFLHVRTSLQYWNDCANSCVWAEGPVGYVIEYGDRADFPNPVAPAEPTIQPGLVPTLQNRLPLYYTNGFSYQVANFDSSFTWTVSSTAGTATISNTGLVSVTGLTSSSSGGQEATVTVNTSKTGFQNASASATSTAPYSLDSTIRAKQISVSLSGTTLTVNVDSPGNLVWAAIWDGAVKIKPITSFPLVIPNYTSTKFQLGAEDSLKNYGYTIEYAVTQAVSKTAQTALNISASQSISVGATTTLSASGGSGSGAVTYSATPSSVCSVSGTTLTGVGAGDCTITATKDSDSTYLSASATKTIQVVSAPDTAPPVISGVSITPTTALEITTVTISAQITDQTGVSSVTATLVRNGSTSVTVPEVGLTTAVVTLRRTSGTDTNGTWSATSGINFAGGQGSGYLVSGLYDLVITATDSGNRTSSSPVQSSVLTVGKQNPNPVVLSPTLSSNTAVLGSAVTISTRAVVYGNTISRVFVWFNGNGIGNLTLTSGTTSDGIWSATLLVPSTLSTGTYSVNISAQSQGRESATLSAGNIRITAAAPSASFTLPIASSTVGGQVTVVAQGSVASTSAGRLAYVCLRKNGAAVSGYVAASGSGTWYYSATAGYGPSANCYQTNSTVSKTAEFKWVIDASTWADGATELSLFVIDSTGSVSPTVTRNVIVKNGVPTVSFTTPTAGSTQSSTFAVKANAAVASGSSAKISYVCFKVDGSLTGSWVNSSANGSWYYGTTNVTNIGTCWSTRYAPQTTELAWAIDSTGFTNGSHTLEVLIIDSTGKQSGWASTNFTVSIANPTVSFTTPTAGSTQSSTFAVKANAAVASGSSAKISYVCFKVDGSLTGSWVNSSANGSWYYGTTNVTNIGTCWSTRYAPQTTELAWAIDSTGFTNGSHTLEVLIIDSTGKQSGWASTNFTVSIANPTVSFTTPTAGSTQSSTFAVKANAAVASGSSAKISYVCFKVDGSLTGSWVNSSANGSWYYGTTNVTNIGTCWSTRYAPQTTELAWAIDSTGFTNGSHTLEVLIIDSTGKQSGWASTNFTVNNPLPTISISTPTMGQSVVGKVVVEIAMGSVLGDVAVGINDGNARSNGYFSTTSRNVSNLPSGTQLWNAGSSKNFSWTFDTSSWPVGSRRIIVSVVDRANQLVTAEVLVNIQSVKPTVVIVSPAQSQTVKGKYTVTAFVTAASTAGRTLTNVGISEQSATPQFQSGYGYSYRMPSKYRSVALPGASSSQSVSWVVDYSKMSPGSYSISIAAEDSAGDVSEQTVQFIVAKALPVVRIISPSADQTINGAVNLKVTATGDPATTAKIAYIAVSSNLFTPQFLGRTTYSCQLDSKYVCLSVDDLKDYSWTSQAGSWKDGNYSLTVIAIDDNGNTGTQSVSFVVSVVAPTVTITSPGSSIISKSPFVLSASAIPNLGSGAEIIALAISDRYATPQFAGTAYYKTVTGLPSDSAIWQVANIKNPSWRLDPSNWNEGDRVINVFAIDSNGKLGQSSITVHVAPEPTWKIELQGAAVLGKSVPVLITMTTDSPHRGNPPIVVVLQSSSTSAGPWTDLGQITLDAAGTGSGRVLVTENLYVRVNHPQLDSVQPGTSPVKRVVNVPDPDRAGGSNGTGAQNEDGSIPSVTCTAPPKAKSGSKIAITCVAEDVQDTSQPVTIYQQTGSGLKKLGSAKIRGTKITGSITVKAKGKTSFILKGSGDSYVPWASNVFSVKYN